MTVQCLFYFRYNSSRDPQGTSGPSLDKINMLSHIHLHVDEQNLLNAI